MELPQPRPLGTEGRKPTHDFLSLYSHSSVQQDPRPPQGGYLKTHDFLQPLERVGNSTAKEENAVENTGVEKPTPPAPPPSVERLLPGGIGTYSISHISYFNQRNPKPEGTIFTVAEASSTERTEENSNCSSYTGGGFTLWEESAVNKGKTGKENAGDRNFTREPGMKLGQWTSERPLQSSANNHASSFSSLSSSKPSSTQKRRSFMDMIKSAKDTQEEEDNEEELLLKKEGSSSQGDLTIKVDRKANDQKANTPRSKHSATEQRRRSKINDRFHALRELIPHSDQKRDKASFLLEVIEYIQFLQEKVHKYEGLYQGWNQEPAKFSPWRNNYRPGESFVDQSRGTNNGSGPAFIFANENKITASETISQKGHPVESNVITNTTFKTLNELSRSTHKVVPLPLHLQPKAFTGGGAVDQLPPRLDSGSNNKPRPQSQLWQIRPSNTDCAVLSDKSKEQELSVEGGTINISTVYSQGLLNTLTQALQSSGVDLSQASISVQIDLGKRANCKLTVPTSLLKDDEVISSNHPTTSSRVTVGGEDSQKPLKRLKTGKS